MNIIIIYGLTITHLFYIQSLPTLQRGQFVISGVSTCGQGSGYCLLGVDCTVNENFLADDNGHCKGLRTAFTPETYFSCCQYVVKNLTYIEKNYSQYPETTFSYMEKNQTFIANVENINKQDFDETHIENDFKIRNGDNSEFENEIDENRNKKLSRIEDISFISDFAKEKIIDINHLGCTLHSESDRTQNHLQLDSDANNHKFETEVKFRSLKIKNLNTGNENTDNFTLLTPVQKFQFTRDLFGNVVNPIGKNCNHDSNAEYSRQPSLIGDIKRHTVKLNVPEELLRGNNNILDDEVTKNKCVNFTTETDTLNRCVNIWKFISNDTIICFGTLMNSVWLLTSASCITKIFETGMDSVTATDVEEIDGLYGISNMLVHENYKTDDKNEMNDVGLVSLNKVTNSSCFACLSNQEKKYADKSCLTYTMTLNRNNQESLNKCQDRVKVLNIHSRIYLSLTCSSADSFRLMIENTIANALWCDNILTGIGTSFNQDSFIFTPINEYAEWIRENIILYL
ncbi:hypothetical protein PGB90_000665 [Kerria lacca]